MKKLVSILLLAAIVFTLAACGGKKEAVPVNLGDVMAKFTLGDEMLSLDENDLLDLYGIKSEDVKQFAGAVNTSGIKCDEIVMIEAVDASAAGRVKSALDNRYQAKLNEMENYIPEEYAVIKECSVTASGNFVAMIVSRNAAELTKTYAEAIK